MKNIDFSLVAAGAELVLFFKLLFFSFCLLLFASASSSSRPNSNKHTRVHSMWEPGAFRDCRRSFITAKNRFCFISHSSHVRRGCHASWFIIPTLFAVRFSIFSLPTLSFHLSFSVYSFLLVANFVSSISFDSPLCRTAKQIHGRFSHTSRDSDHLSNK